MSATMQAFELRPVRSTLSPAMESFENNPFRVLRLRVTATTSDATIQAEQSLTLARVGLSHDEPDVLPWLPAPAPFEIQRAAQSVEEPFVRLKSQLLWFDLEKDSESGQLIDALRSLNHHWLRAYLETGPGTSSDAQASIAHSLNRANLSLLLAAAQANGLVAPKLESDQPTPEIPRESWKRLGSFRSLQQAHTVATTEDGVEISQIGNCWETGLRSFVSVLKAPGFAAYVEQCISDLQDDFVSACDRETVEESLRAHLADLSAQEARFFLQAGRYPIAAALIGAISRSGIDLRILGPAMRPLRQAFQSEISELEAVIKGEPDDLGAIDNCLKRLRHIRTRWLALDSADVVGLRDILDSAAEKAFVRLCASERSDTELGPLLCGIKDIACSDSLRERVNGFEKELEQRRTRICYFCGNDPDYEKSVVLNGSKVTGQERHGNTITTHYALRSAIVLRCARCAELHDYIRRVGKYISVAATPGFLATIWWAFTR